MSSRLKTPLVDIESVTISQAKLLSALVWPVKNLIGKRTKAWTQTTDSANALTRTHALSKIALESIQNCYELPQIADNEWILTGT